MSFKLTLILLVALVGFIRAEPLPQPQDEIETEEAQAEVPTAPEDGVPEETPDPAETEPEDAVEEQEDEENEDEDESEEEESEEANELEAIELPETAESEDVEKRRLLRHRYKCKGKKKFKHCRYTKLCARRFGRFYCMGKPFRKCFSYTTQFRYCCRYYNCLKYKSFWCYMKKGKRVCKGCKKVCKKGKCGYFAGKIRCRRRKICIKKKWVGKKFFC